MRTLTWQLLLLLVLAVVVPLVPVALTARSLLDRSFDSWMATGVTEGARAGLAVTRTALDQEKRAFEEAIRSGAPLDTLESTEIEALPPHEQSDVRGWVERCRARTDSAAAGGGPDPAPAAAGSLPHVAVERFVLQGREQLLGTYADPERAPGVHLFQRPLPDELVAAAAQLTANVQLVETLRRERASVLRGMLATFLVVYGIVLSLVLLAGFWMASRITRPMRALAAGIERVAQGDLTTRVSARSGGEAGRLIAAFNDMVDRLRAEQEDRLRLERLEAWRQMSRRLAHEIKNPLTPIQLAAQELEEAYRGDDPTYASLVRQAGAIIREEVARLRELASGFSTLARAPETAPAPGRGRVELIELLSELARLYGKERLQVSGDRGGAGIGDASAGIVDGSTGITRTAPWAGALPVAGDREALRRAFLNLITNALDAQAGAGRAEAVEVRAGVKDGAAEIHVLDHGPGVPAGERRRIFEPDVTTKPGGFGLGLAIVEATVLQHGGTVEVRDRAGGGADFVVRLPLVSEGWEGEGA
jgi:nitrogen fixation/metabolism regulation signal transduction histidine kinase